MKHVYGITKTTHIIQEKNIRSKVGNVADIYPLKSVTKKLNNNGCREVRDKYQKALKFNVNQESAWTEWIGKINANPKDWDEKRKHDESLTGLSAPERMEKKLAFAKEHIAREELRLAATKIFYATLSPVQRLTFDKGFDVKRDAG